MHSFVLIYYFLLLLAMYIFYIYFREPKENHMGLDQRPYVSFRIGNFIGRSKLTLSLFNSASVSAMTNRMAMEAPKEHKNPLVPSIQVSQNRDLLSILLQVAFNQLNQQLSDVCSFTHQISSCHYNL